MALGVNIVSEFDAKGINQAIRDFKRLKTGADKTAFALQTTTSAVNNGIKNFAKFGAAAGLVSGVLGKKLVDAGSNLEESMSKINVVFGDSAQSVKDFASTAAVSMGISNQQALEAAGTYGNLLQAFGTTREKAAEMSTTMVQLAGDLASFNNVPVADALLAIRSGLSGEAEPLKRFGIAINDVRLKQEALALKLYDGKGQLSVLAKSQAAYALILKDSTLAQGDYSRTSDGVANMQRTLTATFQDISAELGTALLPAFKTLLGFVNDTLLPVFREFSDIVGTEGLGAAFKYLGEQILGALGKSNKFKDVVFVIVSAVVALNIAVGIYTGLQTLATAAMTLFGVAATATAAATNIAFAGIPALIGLVAIALVALAIRFKGFREMLSKLIPAFKFAFNGIANIAEFHINNIIRSINLLIRAYNLLPFVKDKNTLDKVSLGFDKVAKSVTKVASAADFRKFEGFQPIDSTKLPKPPKTPATPTGGGSGSGKETAIEKAQKALAKYTSALKLFASETKSYNDAVKGVATANLSLANATDDVRVAQEKFNKVSKGYGADSKEAKAATKDLAQARRDATRATIGLRDATQSVADAQKRLDDLKSGKAAADATQDLAFATQKVEDAKKSLEDAYVQGGEKTISDALERLNKAYEDQKDAVQAVRKAEEESNPHAIIEAEDDLTTAKIDLAEAQEKVADTAQDVIDKQNELNYVINGAPADSDAYKDALKDLQDALKQEKDAIDAVTEAYEAQTQAIIDLNNAKKGLTDAAKGTTGKQEKDAQKATGIDPNTGLITAPITGGGSGDVLMGGLPNIDFSGIDFSGIDFSKIDLSGIPFLADGGIVNKPTLAMIGESGSEAVIPLSQMGNMGGGNINITVQTGVGDPVAIGKSVVDALQAYQRRSGALQIKVA